MPPSYLPLWKTIKAKVRSTDPAITTLITLIDKNIDNKQQILPLLEQLYQRTKLPEIKELKEELTLENPGRRSLLRGALGAAGAAFLFGRRAQAKEPIKEKIGITIYIQMDPNTLSGWELDTLEKVTVSIESIRKDFKNVQYGFIDGDGAREYKFFWCPPNKKLIAFLDRDVGFAMGAKYYGAVLTYVKTDIKIIYIVPPDFNEEIYGNEGVSIFIKGNRGDSSDQIAAETKRKVIALLKKHTN